MSIDMEPTFERVLTRTGMQVHLARPGDERTLCDYRICRDRAEDLDPVELWFNQHNHAYCNRCIRCCGKIDELERPATYLRYDGTKTEQAFEYDLREGWPGKVIWRDKDTTGELLIVRYDGTYYSDYRVFRTWVDIFGQRYYKQFCTDISSRSVVVKLLSELVVKCS